MMNWKFVKCLKVLLFVGSAIARGHFNDVNLTQLEISELSYENQEIFQGSIMSARKREPKFVGFAIQDDNIRVRT
jgi:hypothetical protein